MSARDHLRDSVLFECDIATHLHGKLPDGALDYRPTPDQRSTLELLRYLAFCGIGSARAMADGEWATYKAWSEKTSDMAAEDFPRAMAEQKEALRELFDGLTDEQLGTVESTLPWGEKVPLGRALAETTLKWLAAYRMQLFLYAKAAGNHDIGTANCWAGVDWKE